MRHEDKIIILIFIIYLLFHIGAGIYFTIINQNGKFRIKKNRRQKAS
jgi:succinate dehydrogenase/fumarate reductase cytochrome b subunit